MLTTTDKKFFCEIIANAVAQAHLTHSDEKLRNRWINAIAKAAAIILEGDTTFLHFNPQAEILYYWSPESNEIYQTSETCECTAYNQPIPQPCYHRAMSCLIKNYYEFQQRPGELAQIDFADALYQPPDNQLLRNLNANYVADIIQIAHQQTGKQIILASHSYGAIPVLQGAHRWQSRSVTRQTWRQSAESAPAPAPE